MINYSGTFSLDWLGWFCLALPIAVILLFILTHYSNRTAAETRSGSRLESELQQEIARSKASGFASSWAAPTLPASVIASIWTHRFIATSTDKFIESRRYASTLAMNWNYNRAAPYIAAVALMSLRDQGLINLSLGPRGKVLDSFERIRIEPTDLARSSSDLPAVEGGLLSASLGFAEKWFGKTTEPSVFRVVTDWIGRTQNRPYRWVVEVAIKEGRALDLYEPVNDQRGRVRRLFGGGPKPEYSIPHLAACEDQVVASVSRWREFGASEPELQQRLLTEVGFGINARQSRGGG